MRGQEHRGKCEEEFNSHPGSHEFLEQMKAPSASLSGDGLNA
jgi:hypothetical protein